MGTSLLQETPMSLACWLQLQVVWRGEPFVSLTEDRCEMNLMWSHGQYLTTFLGADTGIAIEEKTAKHRLRLQRWNERFNDLLSREELHKRSETRRDALILRLLAILTGITLDVNNILRELGWDCFENKLSEALGVAEALVAAWDGCVHGPACAQSMNRTLLMNVRRCRHPKLRRKALSLLSDAETQTAVLSCIAEAIILIDEEAWRASQRGSRDCDCVHQVFICNGHRVNRTCMTYPAHGVAVMQAFTNLEDEMGVPGAKVRIEYGHEDEYTEAVKDPASNHKEGIAVVKIRHRRQRLWCSQIQGLV